MIKAYDPHIFRTQCPSEHSLPNSVLASFSPPPPCRKGGGGEKDAKISQCWQKGGFILFEFLEGEGVKMGE